MRNTAYEWADKLLDGTLAAKLAEYQSEGLKADAIAIALREHDVIVSRETVRRWINAAPVAK